MISSSNCRRSHVLEHTRTIVDFDLLPNGMLGIIVEGVKKFVIHHEYEQADRLMMGDVKFLPDETPVKMPRDRGHLTSLLESLMSHKAVQRLGLVCDMNQAVEVSARLTELLPIQTNSNSACLRSKIL